MDMNKFLKYVAAVALLFVGLGAFAQEKTQAYYNTHESEILPDAQAAFRDGNYDLTVHLCEWYYIIVGDRQADELRRNAEKCAKLITEMNAFASDRRLDKAREKANEVLALNPDDKAAQAMSIIPTEGEINGHEWVDLGLPSGLKWATCNVGASSPIDPGNYFAWGETSTKSKYSWKNYRFRIRGNDTDNVRLSKYNTDAKRGNVDNKTRLDLEDDAAHMNWGGAWRMPTREEALELDRHCTWTWTSQEGMKGYLVKGKNGNSIFLPVTGSKSGLNVPHFGYFWTSSLYDNPSAGVCSHYYQAATYPYSTGSRCVGIPVRPVTE